MFWPDVIDLKLFYRSALGRVAEMVISRSIAALWPHAPDECVLGVGFTQPYLEPYREHAQRILALMPASQGALHWPLDGGKNLTFLADEGDIPLPDESVSRVLLMHALENTEQRAHMMREIWRVLAPNGRLLVIAPNRRGAWARVPSSPFAHGSPFSASQLGSLLRDNRFTPYDPHYTLFTPPGSPLCLKATRFIEYVGSRFFPMFGGLILMEAEKQIYAQSQPRHLSKKRLREDYSPAAQPAMTCDSNS